MDAFPISKEEKEVRRSLASMEAVEDNEKEELRCRAFDIFTRALASQEKIEKGEETLAAYNNILVESSNTLSERVGTFVPSVSVLDSKVIITGTTLLRRAAESFDVNSIDFDLEVYSKKLLSYVCNDNGKNLPDWTKLNYWAYNCRFVSPRYESVLGNILAEVPVPVRKVRTQTDKTSSQKAKTSQPENVRRLQKEEIDIEKILKSMMKDLKTSCNNGPVTLEEFILDPDSFSSSVENLFHVSFLVRDFGVKCFAGTDKAPLLNPPAKGGTKPQENQQKIMSISPKDWRGLIKKYPNHKKLVHTD